jgi:hypothetical protein
MEFRRERPGMQGTRPHSQTRLVRLVYEPGNMKTPNWGTLVVTLSLALAACVGCKKNESTGESIDRNTEKTKDSLKDAGEKTKDALKDAADKTGDALKKAGDKIKESASTNSK